MSDDDFWFPHTVQVEAYRSGGMGASYAAPRSLRAEVRDEHRLVTSADATEVSSTTQVTIPLNAGVGVGARVTIWAGTSAERTAAVLAVQRDENDPDLPSHLILSLE